MSMLFNHGVRHGICDTNPIRLVRQGAKRKKIPIVLTSDEVRKLIEALPLRERTLVLMAAGTGLLMSELFALKWGDVDFDRHEISVVRSIVFQVVGPCKTDGPDTPAFDHRNSSEVTLCGGYLNSSVGWAGPISSDRVAQQPRHHSSMLPEVLPAPTKLHKPPPPCRLPSSRCI
jgi:hypothetical protein